MNEDLSFYLSFAGFSVGVLALSCTLVLLFGRGGAISPAIVNRNGLRGRVDH
jgi:hypothetical protein